MPNWCENDLYIEGPKAEIERFLEAARNDTDGEETELDFNNFIPYPEKYDAADKAREVAAKVQGVHCPVDSNGVQLKDGYNDGGYDWCCDNWGTKWNASEPGGEYGYEDEEESTYVMHFSTAWAPPTPVVKKMGEMFPKLTFQLTFFECGCAFNGVYAMKDGENTDDRTADYFGNRGG